MPKNVHFRLVYTNSMFLSVPSFLPFVSVNEICQQNGEIPSHRRTLGFRNRDIRGACFFSPQSLFAITVPRAGNLIDS
jgi:hypothetical protein